MRARTICVGLTAVTLGLAAAGPSRAQMLVYDPAAVGHLISQAQTALSQLQSLRQQVDQAQQLYDSFNQVSDVNGLAQRLLLPELRKVVPELASLEAAARGDLDALGDLAERAKAIRSESRVYRPTDPTPADEALDQAGDRAARDMALGERIASVATDRLEGLEELRQALDSADNARAVMDISARIAAEQAVILNDQMRLQGVAMMQASEARLERQRERERIEAARVERMAMFRRGFER
ncbi:MAG: type IV secretion system protein [Phenylobacterium sp.]|uniref:type IV secretion system protein n=1 Tax=Phenylobacterium sp. TaxID=1871053 RepID=UPI002735A477|nr:type IV secretion system protein [Phenylobacterium sp.]MDP3749296.1 type IV secretion system protein [Phenylobacterium sp.]